jgi:hypothetical protein
MKDLMLEPKDSGHNTDNLYHLAAVDYDDEIAAVGNCKWLKTMGYCY